MSLFTNPEALALAADQVYVPEQALGGLAQHGYTLFDRYPPQGESSGTGFYAEIYENSATNSILVAFRGTDPSAQDAYTDLQYGFPQYEDEEFRRLVTDVLDQISDPAIQIQSVDFVGHSLGGALAQYAAHDILRVSSLLDNQPTTSVTTFNGLGGLAGAQDFIRGGLDTTLFANVDATHYRIKNDGVALLGEGHLGGEVRVIDKGNDLDPFAAHSISQFTGTGDTSIAPVNFDSAEVEANTGYLQIAPAVAQAQSSAIINTLNSDASVFSDLEAAGRLLTGVLPALRNANDDELQQLEETVGSESIFTRAA